MLSLFFSERNASFMQVLCGVFSPQFRPLACGTVGCVGVFGGGEKAAQLEVISGAPGDRGFTVKHPRVFHCLSRRSGCALLAGGLFLLPARVAATERLFRFGPTFLPFPQRRRSGQLQSSVQVIASWGNRLQSGTSIGFRFPQWPRRRLFPPLLSANMFPGSRVLSCICIQELAYRTLAVSWSQIENFSFSLRA